MSNEQEGNLLGHDCTPERAEQAFAMLEGRWKVGILHHLFSCGTMRFSDLERAMPRVSQRMLTVQLRALERDGMIARTIYPEVPPKVEYTLTDFGRQLKPVLHAMLVWAAKRSSR